MYYFRKIVFTKLGTVKTKDFEIPIKDFVSKMSRLILIDSDENSVIQYKSDGSYVVEYEGNNYGVFYEDKELKGECEDKIINYYLDQLVNMTELQNAISSEEKNKARKVNEKKKQQDQALDGIDKEVKQVQNEIDELIKKDKEDGTKVFQEVINVYKSEVFEKVSDNNRAIRFVLGLCGLAGVLASIISLFAGGISLWLLIPSLIVVFDASAMFMGNNEWKGIYASFGYMFISLVYLNFCIINKIGEKIKLFLNLRPLKLKLRKLKNSKAYKNKLKNTSVEEIKTMLEEAKDSKEEKVSEDMAISFKEFEELKDNILSIKDEAMKKELANELYRLIDYCIKVAQNPVKDRSKACATLLEKVSNLRENVTKIINKENNMQEEDKTFYRLMSEIDGKIEDTGNDEEYVPQKSIGAR